MLAWSVSRPAGVLVHFIEDGGSEKRTVASVGTARAGTITVPGLKSGRRYLYSAEFRDETGAVLREPVKAVSLPEENLALGKAVTGTFTNIIEDDPYFQRGPDIVQRITDGRTAYFSGTAVSGDATFSDQWCIVDLGSEQVLDRIEVVWRSLSCSTNYSIDLSADGHVWRQAARSLDGRSGLPGKGEAGDPILTCRTDLRALSGRYVRLTVHRGSARNKHERWKGVQLMEIRIFR